METNNEINDEVTHITFNKIKKDVLNYKERGRSVARCPEPRLPN